MRRTDQKFISVKRFFKNHFLIGFIFAVVVGCSGVHLNPAHNARFQFSGVVKDSHGKPLENVLVKINGWETLSNAKGQWSQEQVIHCGALRDDPSGKKNFESILFIVEGYQSHEENFMIKHPSWFGSCEEIQPVIYETTLYENQENKPELKKSTEKNLPPVSGGVDL